MGIQQLLAGAGGKAKTTYIDDVYHQHCYRGNSTGSTTQAINTGFDLAADGGLVWSKRRHQADNHYFLDSERSNGSSLMYSNSSGAPFSTSGIGLTTVPSSTGYTAGNSIYINSSSWDFASWTFKRNKGFFDIQKYTGNGSNRTIAHNLGSVPGMIFIKRISSAADWQVYHAGMTDLYDNPAKYFLTLNETHAKDTSSTIWNDTVPTSTHFSIGTGADVNANTEEYIAYIFAGGESTLNTTRSIEFDGTQDYLWGAANNDFNCTGDLTLEFWVNPDDIDDTILLIGETGGAFGVHLYLDSDGLKMNHSGALKMTVAKKYIPKGQWTHVALVRSGTRVDFYINGVSRATYSETNAFGGSSDSQKTMLVGGAHNGGGVTDYFDGKICNLRLVKGTAVYTAAFNPPTEPLGNITNTVLLWCNGQAGGTFVGSLSAFGGPGTYQESPFDDPAAFKFGENQEGIIKCGGYIGDGNNGSSQGVANSQEIFLGWEPQWILIKRTNSAESWILYDSLRGVSSYSSASNDSKFEVNNSDAESLVNHINITSKGFTFTTGNAQVNQDGNTYVYTAIRRPDPAVQKPAELGTEVFAMDTASGSSVIPNFDSGFVVDFAITRPPDEAGHFYSDIRLTPGQSQHISGNSAANGWVHAVFDSNAGWQNYNGHNSSDQGWMFKRHSGFDVVSYQGNDDNGIGTVNGQAVPHSLSKTPEMIWVKCRTSAKDWKVYHKGLNGGTNPEQYHLVLNSTAAKVDSVNIWSDIAPTSTHFTVGDNGDVNDTGKDYIAMLFASVEGISKVGSYTGNANNTHTVTLGFAPRFILIKRADDNEHWLVLDTLRGWVAGGNTKTLYLQTNTAQSTITTSLCGVSPTSTGVEISGSQGFANVSGGNYLYYAHA